jgi:hypothetical protein
LKIMGAAMLFPYPITVFNYFNGREFFLKDSQYICLYYTAV